MLDTPTSGLILTIELMSSSTMNKNCLTYNHIGKDAASRFPFLGNDSGLAPNLDNSSVIQQSNFLSYQDLIECELAYWLKAYQNQLNKVGFCDRNLGRDTVLMPNAAAVSYFNYTILILKK